MQTTSEIRRAGFLDEPELWEIVEPLQAPAFHWPRDLFLSEFQTTETWILRGPGPAGKVFVKAFVCVRDAGDVFELSVLATGSEFQGQGCMKELLKTIVPSYNERRHVFLEVHEHNLKAQKLYEKLGFIKNRTRISYYSDGASAIEFQLPLGALSRVV